MTLKLGETAEAVEHWKKAVELDPNHGEALYNLFRTLRSIDPDQAMHYQERFQTHQKERRITDRAEALGNFALTSLKAGDWEEAISQLKEALEVCGECRTKSLLHKNLGLIYARSGDLKNAIPELLLAAELKPDDPEVARSLKTVERLESQKAQAEP